MAKKNKPVTRLIILLVVVIAMLSWAFINSPSWESASFKYIVLAILSIFGIYFFNKFGEGKIFGIDDNWGFDLLVGVILGILIIVLTSLNILGSFADNTGNVINQVFGAGIIETSFFFVLGIALFSSKIKIGKKNIPYPIALIIVGLIFAVFHFTKIFPSGDVSFLGLQSNLGFFVSAVVLSFIWGYTLKWTKSALPLIVSHMIFNAWAIREVIKAIFGI